MVSCAVQSESENDRRSGATAPAWVQGLREPLKDLPAEEWMPDSPASVADRRARVGQPVELGGRLDLRPEGSQPAIPSVARNSGAGSTGQVTVNVNTGLDPVVEARTPRAPSALEMQFRGMFASGPDRELEQFGYAQIERLGTAIGSFEGPASSDHVVAVGDEFIVDLTTDRVERFRARVEADGTLELAGLLSVRVAGESFADAQEIIRTEVARTRRGFDLSVGLGRLASIPVRVIGEAESPGVVDAGPRPTLLDAIGAAGVRRSGSLRRVGISRADGERITVDLYDYLLGREDASDIRLTRGDTVILHPVGPTIGIAGSVQRPGIYELLLDGRAPTVPEAIELAGGGTGFAITDQVQIERTRDGQRVLIDVDPMEQASPLQDGDLLLIGAVDGRLHPIVEVRGEVAQPGRFQHRGGMSVADLVRMSGGLTVDAFDGQAVVSRRAGESSPRDSVWDGARVSTSRRVIVVDLAKAMRGDPDHDIKLEPLDMLRVNRFDEAGDTPTVEVIGAARRPGTYELTAGMSVSDLIAIAGNLTPDAFAEEAELVRRRRTEDATVLDVDRYRIPLGDVLAGRAAGPRLETGDRFILRRLSRAEARVRVDGMVRFPGEYVLPSGAKITDLIAAAGGLIEGADLRAAQFSRDSVRAVQLARWEQMAARTRQTFERNLEDRVNSARSKEAFSARIQLEQVQASLERLRVSQASGRIILPFMQDDFPDSDANLILETGDSLVVPRATNTITVQGHVFNPITVVFGESVSTDDLIDRAGGLTETADKERLYVVRADGQVASVEQRGGRFRLDTPLLAGDVVLVPPRPLGRDAGSVVLDLLLLARSAGEAGALWNLAFSQINDGSISIIDTPASPRSDSTPPAELLREFQR